MTKLDLAFYNRPDVLEISRELLGKILTTNIGGIATSGRIVEVEAYNGIVDRASHAYNGRRTKRTEVMYAPGGTAYVYLIYGIHHLFNVVTNDAGIPHAILIRALEPLEGITEMLRRTGRIAPGLMLTSGPGNLSRALGITVGLTGASLLSDTIFLADDGTRYEEKNIRATPRIGVDYAGSDAALPYRFLLASSPYISGRRIID